MVKPRISAAALAVAATLIPAATVQADAPGATPAGPGGTPGAGASLAGPGMTHAGPGMMIEEPGAPVDVAHHGAVDDGHGGGAHHAHRNHVAVFAGTTVTAEATGPSIGLDFERRFGRLGVAVLVDTTRMHDVQHVVVAPALVVHPWAGLKVLVGVGLEHASGHDVAVVRGSVGYDVHVGALSVGPALALDRADGEAAVVAGAAIGAGF